jgi:cytochrome b involved in lipid metabolism
VTDFALKHPGGQVIYTYAGKDATDVFSCFHAQTTWQLLRPFMVGTLEVSNPVHRGRITDRTPNQWSSVNGIIGFISPPTA